MERLGITDHRDPLDLSAAPPRVSTPRFLQIFKFSKIWTQLLPLLPKDAEISNGRSVEFYGFMSGCLVYFDVTISQLTVCSEIACLMIYLSTMSNCHSYLKLQEVVRLSPHFIHNKKTKTVDFISGAPSMLMILMSFHSSRLLLVLFSRLILFSNRTRGFSPRGCLKLWEPKNRMVCKFPHRNRSTSPFGVVWKDNTSIPPSG